MPGLPHNSASVGGESALEAPRKDLLLMHRQVDELEAWVNNWPIAADSWIVCLRLRKDQLGAAQLAVTIEDNELTRKRLYPVIGETMVPKGQNALAPDGLFYQPPTPPSYEDKVIPVPASHELRNRDHVRKELADYYSPHTPAAYLGSTATPPSEVSFEATRAVDRPSKMDRVRGIAKKVFWVMP